MTQKLENVLNSKFALLPMTVNGLTRYSAGLRAFPEQGAGGKGQGHGNDLKNLKDSRMKQICLHFTYEKP